MATERAAAVKELQKVKDRVAEQEKALKAINTALSDTPENVIKKMNVLKKQKQEEADMRRQIESSLNTLRTEKKQQDQKAAAGEKLAAQYRELHEISVKLHERAKAALPDDKDLPAVPELDCQAARRASGRPSPTKARAGQGRATARSRRPKRQVEEEVVVVAPPALPLRGGRAGASIAAPPPRRTTRRSPRAPDPAH